MYKKDQSRPVNKSTEQVIYGIHAVAEALDIGKDINKVIIQQDTKNDATSGIMSLCKQRHIPFQLVPKEKFNFLREKNHQGVAAYLSAIVYQSIEEILPALYEAGKVPFIIILDRITDVRNFGAIARSAFCGGVDAIVVPFSETAPINDDAIKTSAGALLKIPVCREKNLKTTLEFLNQSAVTTVACTEKANKHINFIDLKVPLAIILGNEEHGISNDLIRKCESIVKIPLEFGVQSLNVSVAAGIAIYETVRQRMNK